MSAITNEEIAALLKDYVNGAGSSWRLAGKLADALEKLAAEREWQPIETAPLDLIEGHDAPLEIASFHRGDLLWSCAAYWGSSCYGDSNCASRSGWYTAYFPPTAKGTDRPKPTGSWIMPDSAEAAPTHWRRFPPAPPTKKEEDSHE